jgi:tRNA-uridine 2-sulfurtransferase
MSGGVDSSVAAHLLVEQGYEVVGVYLECWRAPGCRTEEDRKDALAVALDLGIPFQVLDFKEAYRQQVVEYFFAEYEAGRTPNPDVMCNKEIKFGLFYDWAINEGFDFVATGHYAKITEFGGQHHLVIPADTHKDQTYFLFRLRPDQLAHTLFPLQDLTKPQVRQLAQDRHLSVAAKKDSVGICFIGDINVHGFLKERLGENPGAVVDVKGNVIGEHQGLWFYTIGQRHGFSINKSTLIKQSDGTTITKQNIPPFYVIAKDSQTNQLVVGFGVDAQADTFTLNETHWLTKPDTTLPLFVRIRHTGQLLSCTFDNFNSPKPSIRLETPIQGLADGQAAVFYQQVGPNQVCLGGGLIEQTRV